MSNKIKEIISLLVALNASFSAGSFAYGSGDATGAIHTDDGTLAFDDYSFTLFIDGLTSIDTDRSLSQRQQLLSLKAMLSQDLKKLHKLYDLRDVQDKIRMISQKKTKTVCIATKGKVKDLIQFISTRFAGHKYIFTVVHDSNILHVYHIGTQTQVSTDYLDISDNVLMSLSNDVIKKCTWNNIGG